MTRTSRRLALIAAAAITTTSLMACGDESAQPIDLCSALGDEPPKAAVAGYVDASASAAVNTGSIDWLLDQAASTQSALSVATFAESDAAISPVRCLTGRTFVARGNNRGVRDAGLPRLIDAARTAILAAPTGGTETDIAAAYRAGAAALSGQEIPKYLVILTDGISTSGCAALPERADPSNLTLADELAADCMARGLLPNLRGVNVIVIGVGQTEGADLTSEAVSYLIDMQTTLCEATAADSCRVESNPSRGL